jgi:hypothetical protein
VKRALSSPPPSFPPALGRRLTAHVLTSTNLQHPKLQWRHSDNIILFLNFTQSALVGLPKSFIFETIDLYEKKNLPKVIFCVHSLRCVFLARPSHVSVA